MFNLLFTLAAAGAGYFLGSLSARRTIDERIDSRLAELGPRIEPKAAAPVDVAPAAVPRPVADPKPKAVVKPVEEEISPETLTVITAAICAFLGKPAKIRRVRRLPIGGNPWAQVGRVNVMTGARR